MWAYLFLGKTILHIKNVVVLAFSTVLINAYLELPFLDDLPWLKWITTPAFLTIIYILFNYWNSNRKTRLEEFNLTTKAMKDLIDSLNTQNTDLSSSIRELRVENNEIYQEVNRLRNLKEELEDKIEQLTKQNKQLIKDMRELKELLYNGLDSKTK